jgi:hypothetical protein
MKALKMICMMLGAIALLPIMLLAGAFGGWIWTVDREGAQRDIAA